MRPRLGHVWAEHDEAGFKQLKTSTGTRVAAEMLMSSSVLRRELSELQRLRREHREAACCF